MAANFLHPQIHAKYRPDIDGLRAIAVMSVIGFHAFPEWVHGGYIGVDIFFVISGYLISTIIFENLAKGSFSFVDFYYRRVSRIFPALIAVFIFCYLFGWFFFTPLELSQLGKHISSGAAFISNFTLWKEDGYFNGSSGKKILLHLWSLGIEEQFYFLWPILIWIAWRARINLWAILAISLLSSFIVNITSIGRDPVSVFYHPGTRVWELLIGATLANLHVRKDKYLLNLQKNHSNLLSITGILLILLGLILLNKDSEFPGWWALLPTLGAVLIIAAESASWINRHVLSSRFLVWLGLISFPLYLWHWPLLAAAQTIFTINTPPQLLRAALVMLSILLAWATYRFIEIPLRRVENSHKKFFLLIALMAVCGAVGYATFKFDGSLSRFNVAPLQIRYGDMDCSLADSPSGGKPCIFGNLNSDKTVLMYGDSYSGHLTKAIMESKVLVDQYKFVFFGRTRCFLKEADTSEHCQLLRGELDKYSQKNIFAVIRSHNLYRYGAHTKKDIKDYLLTAASDAERFHPEKIIITGDLQVIDTDCEFANYYIDVRKKRCDIDHISADINKEFSKVARESAFPKNVFFILPYEKICANGDCQIINGSISYYSDTKHLSTDGALLFMPDIEKILGNSNAREMSAH